MWKTIFGYDPFVQEDVGCNVFWKKKKSCINLEIYNIFGSINYMVYLNIEDTIRSNTKLRTT